LRLDGAVLDGTFEKFAIAFRNGCEGGDVSRRSDARIEIQGEKIVIIAGTAQETNIARNEWDTVK
jgi:hypothetical protein